MPTGAAIVDDERMGACQALRITSMTCLSHQLLRPSLPCARLLSMVSGYCDAAVLLALAMNFEKGVPEGNVRGVWNGSTLSRDLGRYRLWRLLRESDESSIECGATDSGEQHGGSGSSLHSFLPSNGWCDVTRRKMCNGSLDEPHRVVEI